MNRRIRLVLSALPLLAAPVSLPCQDNALDLRFVEFNSHNDVTYQNFIYARTLAGGKFIAQADYLRLPINKYDEVAVAVGIRVGAIGDATLYALAGFGHATDASYAEPAVFIQDTKGRFTYAVFFQRYEPVNRPASASG